MYLTWAEVKRRRSSGRVGVFVDMVIRFGFVLIEVGEVEPCWIVSRGCWLVDFYYVIRGSDLSASSIRRLLLSGSHLANLDPSTMSVSALPDNSGGSLDASDWQLSVTASYHPLRPLVTACHADGKRAELLRNHTTPTLEAGHMVYVQMSQPQGIDRWVR